MNRRQRRNARAANTPRGFTLVELILALSIIAVLGTGVCTLITASMNTDRFLRSTNASQSEVELAVDRISNNIREAQTGSIVVGSGTLTTLTQADTANGYASGATITYSLITDPSNASLKVLQENDPRCGGNNILVHNVTTFTVTLVSGFTDLYQIDLVTGSSTSVERHFKVQNRN